MQTRPHPETPNHPWRLEYYGTDSAAERADIFEMALEELNFHRAQWNALGIAPPCYYILNPITKALTPEETPTCPKTSSATRAGSPPAQRIAA